MDGCKDKEELFLFLADLAKFTKNALKTVECYLWYVRVVCLFLFLCMKASILILPA